MIRTEGTGAWYCEGNSNNNIINIKLYEAKQSGVFIYMLDININLRSKFIFIQKICGANFLQNFFKLAKLILKTCNNNINIIIIT